MAAPARRKRGSGPGTARLLQILCALPALLGGTAPLGAQDRAPVSLEVRLAADSSGKSRDAVVQTLNLLEDTPWLATLRQGLPVRLSYRLETWRSREGWFDVLDRQIDWTVVVRHEPLLDQFYVVRLLPPNQVLQNRIATPGALAELLRVSYRFAIAPKDEGRFYYAATLNVATLSDSDLDNFDRALRGELNPRSGESLAQRARRLILRLAGLPALNLSARSETFEVKR